MKGVEIMKDEMTWKEFCSLALTGIIVIVILVVTVYLLNTSI